MTIEKKERNKQIVEYLKTHSLRKTATKFGITDTRIGQIRDEYKRKEKNEQHRHYDKIK